MHCVSSYPTEKNINLSNIRELNNYFKIQVGFSDHTTGIDAAIQAISYGAKVIEKHFLFQQRVQANQLITHYQ